MIMDGQASCLLFDGIRPSMQHSAAGKDRDT